MRPDVGLIDIKTSSLDKYLNDSKILSNARFFHDAAGSPSFKFVKVVQGMLIFITLSYDVLKILRPDVGLIDIKTSSLNEYLNDSKILSNARYFHDEAGIPSFKFVKVVQVMLIFITLTTTF